ncbi:MAG: hypothetical protein H6604_07440 [Flavobacteriales bacterium]|nr:hypothetical protein [Flavobacteriales bacterium]
MACRISLLLLVFFNFIFGQNTEEASDIVEQDSIKIYNPTWNDYKYEQGNKTYTFDSTFTIKKMFERNNFTQKDIFNKLHFSNIGQTFQPLIYENSNESIDFIPYGKSHNLISQDEVRYFNVKTPTTEFSYNNGFREGHSLRTTFTHNITPRWNYAAEYYGLRSLGKYNRELSATNTFLFSSNYNSKNKRYNLKTHYIASNINNEENGGISKSNLDDFIENNTDFRQRDRISVNLNSSESKYHRRRYFLEQKLGLIKGIKQDSTAYFPIAIRNKTFYELSELGFSGGSDTLFFDTTYLQENVKKGNSKFFKKFHTTTSAVFNWKEHLKFEAGVVYENLNYIIGNETTINSITIPRQIQDNRIGLSGSLNVNWNDKIQLNSNGNFSTGDYFKSTFKLNSDIALVPFKDYLLTGMFSIKSLPPQLNLLANQSYYKRFNYYLSNYENELTTEIQGRIHAKKYHSSAGIHLFNISNYTYINSDGKAEQSINPISIVQFNLDSDIRYRKFGLNTKITYQTIDDSDKIIPLPNLVSRLTLYYQTPAFKRAATLQTGVRLYYFSSFKAREFNPVLNEFMISNSDVKIGSYPIFDVFFNMKVKRMQIFAEAQHINSSFSKDFRVDPVRPFYDFRLNFGINWLIFN